MQPLLSVNRIQGALALLALWSLVPAPSALADGFDMKDGRFQGPVTVLVLNDAQVEALAKAPALKLTKEQSATLASAAGAGPSEVYVYTTIGGAEIQDCTCGAYNVAMRFSERQIEVPHQYVVSDEEAARRKAEAEEE